MKKLLMAVMFLVMAVAAQAQTYVWQSMDSSVKDGYWDLTQTYNNQGDAVAKFDVSDNAADKKEGAGSVKIAYTVGAGDSWGGYIVRTTVAPTLPNYINLSTGTEFTFWYKVTKPVVTTQAGTVFMEFKLGDFDADNKRDLWYMEMPVDLADASGTWKQAKVSIATSTFKVGGDKTKEWNLQFGDGDQEIQLDKIKGSEIAFVYITGGTATSTPTATGEILMDGFAVTGDAYAPPLVPFVNEASKFTTDVMSWAGAGNTSTMVLTDEATDKPEGTAGALKVDYTAYASQDWGGYCSAQYKIATPPAKMAERTVLSFYVKNAKAVTTSVPKRAMLRVTISEQSNAGQTENWMTKIPIDLTQVSGWTRYDLPLVEKKLIDGDQHPAIGGFGQNGSNGNKIFNPENITQISFDLFAIGAGEDKGPKGEKLTGTILFAMMQLGGFQLVDKTAPAAPVLSAIKGTYSNLVSWGDVANEGTEKYYVYASKSPITSLTAKGVEKIGTDIARGVQVFEHLLKSPKVDKDVTFYYAIQAIDKNQNIGAIGTAGPITNKAKGIPTIALKTPNFVADGNLNEWAGITPFVLKTSNGTGFLVPGDTNTGDADNSAEAVYVALDKNNLYVAYDINDNVVLDDPKYYPGSTWQADAAELFIGLYNMDEVARTVAYKHGKTPDYHLRFNKQKAREDHWEIETTDLLLPGPNYYWNDKFPSGYVIEAKIPLKDLATKRNTAAMPLDEIYVKEGFRVMFDLGIFDADDLTVNRKSRIFWTPSNKDHGYENATLWGFTWLGDTDVIATGVEDAEMPVTYSLDQNYPNPFNPTTQIKYSVANAGNVSLKVFDVLGREVADLVNKHQDAGHYSVNFNASALSSGIYFYRIESGSFVSVKKMMLVK
ncbi:MAG: hypothetical protein FD178_1276 [Ignavibacteria bacterium]|nr:MAG: hypothetical protein FD178_1276 [Ignavibacteria bacterium]